MNRFWQISVLQSALLQFPLPLIFAPPRQQLWAAADNRPLPFSPGSAPPALVKGLRVDCRRPLSL